MKCFFIILAFGPMFLCAQQPIDWGAFSKVLPGKELAGKRFRLEAAVRTFVIDSTASAFLWVRVDKTNKQMGFFNNMHDQPIRSREWKVYRIEGKIDKDAAHLVFGGIYARKGIFCFDDFKLWVEQSKGVYEPVALPNAGFEADTVSNWGYFKQVNGFSVAVSSDSAYEGRHSLRVDGSTFKKAPAFGENDSLGHYVQANGIRLYYEEYGHGAPLLLLHGNSSSINSFRLQIPAFSKYYRVIAVDTRGQGKSGEDGKLYTYDQFAADMNALLDTLRLDSVNVLGWSDGGNTGLIMAMQYPRKVKKLVSMGANVFIDETVVDKWVFKELHKQVKELAEDTSTWGKNRARLVHLLLTEPRHRFEELAAIHCPVLVLAGEKDLIKPGHTKEIAAHIPGSILVIASKETHYYPWENAAGFNKTVLDFFERK